MAKRKSKTITVKGIFVTTQQFGKDDFISLTDMAKYKSYDSGVVISNWLSTKYTILFMGAWEQVHNQYFNLMEFNKIKNEAGSNGYIVSSSFWINSTNAIGIVSKPGRYGGTFAHKDIAFEFATWLSPEFKLYLIKEFQRLKEEEIEHKQLGWDLKRNLASINYRIHTDAVKKHLIPPKVTNKQASLTYASEADLLNKALFGKTAKEWRDENSDTDGNIRDHATAYQLVCLSNLESINAEYIKDKLSQGIRLQKLNAVAIAQMKSLLNVKSISKLTAKKLSKKK